MRRFSLRAQFILLIVVGLSAIFTIIAVYVVRLSASNVRQSLVGQSTSFASLATKPIGDTFITYQDSGRLRIVQQVEKFTDLDSAVTNVAIVDLNGNVQYQQHDGTIIPVTPGQASSFDPIYVNQGGQLTRIITPYIEDFGAHRYSLVYDISHDIIDQDVRQLSFGIIALALLALLISIIATYLVISRLFIRPMHQLSATAIAISQGNLDKKIEAVRNDEIGDLAKSVNTMAESLKADIRKLKETDALKTEFMMIASHNLRTPISVIQGYLDNLLHVVKISDEARQMIEVVMASSSRLGMFAEDILTVSRLEAGEDVFGRRQVIDLQEMLVEVVSEFSALTKQKGLKFDINITKTACFVNVSPPHIRAAIWNLLDNALKFTTEGSVSLSLETSGSQAVVQVTDTGTGIEPSEVAKLFTKFHRGTSTWHYDFEGTGIGLYLTKLIIDEHGGTIRVTSQPKKGSVFTISLPLAPSSDRQSA